MPLSFLLFHHEKFGEGPVCNVCCFFCNRVLTWRKKMHPCQCDTFSVMHDKHRFKVLEVSRLSTHKMHFKPQQEISRFLLHR